MKGAVIDIGSNSIRLFVGQNINNDVVILHRDLKTTRLGRGVSKEGILDPISMEKSLDVIESFCYRARSMGCEIIKAYATSAVREASNGRDFVERVKKLSGIDVGALSGEEEARLSFEGAKAGLKIGGAALVIDIGGGSTELTVGSDEIIKSVSLPMGAVRFTQNILFSDPPTPEEVQKADAEAGKLLTEFAGFYNPFNQDNDISSIGVGGTFTTLAALAQELRVYDSDKVHGFALDISVIEKIFSRLLSLTVVQKKSLPGLQPERADIITAGSLIALAIMRRLNLFSIKVSESDWCFALMCRFLKNC